jgi:CheY-like chemotaxis protein
MKILIVDDQKVPAESLKLAIEQHIANAKVSIHLMFETAFETIQAQSPDVLVLDIFKNPAQDENAGDDVRKQVWDNHFCPIIIYTAKPQESHKESKHPFVTLCVKKGTKESDDEVIAKLNFFKSHTEVLRKVRQQANKAIGDSLRDVCSVIWTDETANKEEVIGRIAKRRVAALMDESSESDSDLRPWEQYIYPTISHHLLTGDIIKKTGKPENTDPSDFFVVLSPSCDLVQRKGCIEQVLVAECGPVNDFLKAVELETAKAPKLAEKLPKLLTRDQVNGVLCLPALPSVFPLMSINLKKLCLLDLKGITVWEKVEQETHHRLASVDSPFRERVSFAFTQVTGRPGLPDINWQQLIETISDAVGKAAEVAGAAKPAEILTGGKPPEVVADPKK